MTTINGMVSAALRRVEIRRGSCTRWVRDLAVTYGADMGTFGTAWTRG
jgi:hypothetical protein